MTAVFLSSVLILLLSIGLYYVSKYHELQRLPIVEGFFQPEFMKLAVMLRNNMEADMERGGSVAVFHDSEPVVDMWMGYADITSLRRWRNETRTLAFGCSYAAIAATVALLIDRDILNVSMPISHYWLEFGNNGKQDITLEMLLSNQVKMIHGTDQVSLRDINTHRQKVDQHIASLGHKLISGQEVVEDDVEYGLILDALVRRVDAEGRDMATYFEEEIARPWGVEFSMHLRSEDVYNTARLHHDSWRRFLTSSLGQVLASWSKVVGIFQSWVRGQPLMRTSSYIKELSMPVTVFNDYELREITLPSLSGTGTARGLAKLFSVFATNGYLGNHRVLTQKAVDMVYQMIYNRSASYPVMFGRGLLVWQYTNGDRLYGHLGYGGQMVMVDPKNSVSVAYMSNFLSTHALSDDPRLKSVLEILYTCLDSYTHRLKHSGG